MKRHEVTHIWQRTAGVAIAVLIGSATLAGASQWNDRTVLKFSEPVMVPGATLQSGSYVFKLTDSSANRHLVQITTEDESKLLALAQAVPLKREDAKGDVVVKFAPSETGSPPAVKAWFYAGSTYGHEFVYPDAQAREIAKRTKTIVLSTDVPGSDLDKGQLRTYNAAGMTAEWRGDAATMREWDEWQRSRRAAATTPSGTAATREAPGQTRAPMIESDPQGMRVKLDELEDNPQKYIGKTVSVDAEIEDVFGPRVFTIDESNWGDLEGEILVYVPTTLAALVKEDDRVTITGTVKPFVRADLEREWGWLTLDPEVEATLRRSPSWLQVALSAATTIWRW